MSFSVDDTLLPCLLTLNIKREEKSFCISKGNSRLIDFNGMSTFQGLSNRFIASSYLYFCVVSLESFLNLVLLNTNIFKHIYLTYWWYVNRYCHSRVDLRVMAMKRYFALPRAQEMELLHWIQFSVFHLEFAEILLAPCFGDVWYLFVWFYGISTLVGYLMPNLFLCINMKYMISKHIL